METKKIEFKGIFALDGCGDIEPYWLVDKETYVRILGEKSLEDAEKENGKYRLFANSFLDFKKVGKTQSISIRIVTE